MRDPRPSNAARGPRELHVTVATESATIVEALSELCVSLLGGAARVAVLPQDGLRVLSLFRNGGPTLAFVPLEMQPLEAITVLRLLGPRDAARLVLLVPPTSEGLRAAWAGLAMGALDFLVVRPDGRLQGDRVFLAHRLARLLARTSLPESAGARFGARPLVAPGASGARESIAALLPETPSLARVAAWLRAQPTLPPVVLRVAEGRRFVRVVRAELDRTGPWPVRVLADGDRLVRGQIHLHGEGEWLSIEQRGERCVVRLESEPTAAPIRERGAQRLARLLDSTAPLTLFADPEDQSVLERMRELGDEHREWGALHEIASLGASIGDADAEDARADRPRAA